MGVRSVIGGEDFGRRMLDAGDLERDASYPYRIVSAPPEEEMRSDPVYMSYYYSHNRLNPQLPPQVLSEDWRFVQRGMGGGSEFGGIGDCRSDRVVQEVGGRSMQHGLGLGNGGGVEAENAPGSGEWLDRGEDGLIGLSGSELGRKKSFADLFQAVKVTTPAAKHGGGTICRSDEKKSIDMDDPLGRSTPFSGHLSRPASCNTFTENTAEAHTAPLREALSKDGLRPGQNVKNLAGLQSIGASMNHPLANIVGSSISRSTTPDQQLVARASSPRFPPVGARLETTDMNINNGPRSLADDSSNAANSEDLLSALSCLSMSTSGAIDAHNFTQSKFQKKLDVHKKIPFDLQGGQTHNYQHPFLIKPEPGHVRIASTAQSSYPCSARRGDDLMDFSNSMSRPDGQVEYHMPNIQTASTYLKGGSATSVASPGSFRRSLSVDVANESYTGNRLATHSPRLQSTMENHTGSINLPPLFENEAAASELASLGINSRATGAGYHSGALIPGEGDLRNFDTLGNPNAGAALQISLTHSLYIQHLKTGGYASHFSSNFGDPSIDRSHVDNSYLGLLELHKAYLGALLQSQELYRMPFLGKTGALRHAYYGNPAYSLDMTYPGKNNLAATIHPASPVGPGGGLRHGDRNVRFSSGFRNFTGGVKGSWHSDHNVSVEENFPSSLLEELKSNKIGCFELSEIRGHVVEFSADQYGSRFIQQKLETATNEEKDMVFEEIMPQALSLMTDVFGNYVVQKFFEHGSAAQIEELADKLNGHVLALSLQMYGCRVIQKAVEVVRLDQKTRMIAELDGHIMRCVRDQNGNHVIQKCIECIPQDAIQFVISTFYQQIVTLSTHPYGCRVVQRILEHCDHPETQQIVMDEIMQCVCTLAQDQYGNYVIQHVLEHGKPHERSSIIKKLAGQIVQMSQQKFASNVVEKCLTFGGPGEREILVNEMLGYTDENEPLQAIMKDQFGNYVVQKVLEICDNQQRELILSRIKVHLSALKKYTYGKHIVARVEKLVAAGERRMGLHSLGSF